MSLDGRDLPEDFVRTIFSTKLRDWQYEREVRMLVPLDALVKKDGLYFRPFGPDIRLKEVIAGHRCPVGRNVIARSIGAGRTADVAITKARLAFGSFRVVTNQQGFRHSPKQDWE